MRNNIAIVSTPEIIVKAASCALYLTISNQKEHTAIHMLVLSPCLCAQMDTQEDVKTGLSTSFPLELKETSLCISHGFSPWGQLVLDVGDQLGNFCILIKLPKTRQCFQRKHERSSHT